MRNKVAIIGVGKVTKEFLKDLSYSTDGIDIELLLITSERDGSKDRVKGFYLDLLSSRSAKQRKIISNYSIESDYNSIQNADMVIICAGKWATPEEVIKYRKIDPSGRLVQSLANYEMMKNIAEKIKMNCPNSIVVVVSNQVDMMANLLRNNLPKSQTVIGLSTIIDNIRFNFLLEEYLNQTEYNAKNKKIEGFIIGYHNKDIILLTNTLFVDNKGIENLLSNTLSQNDIDNLIQETKDFGSRISKLSRDQKYPSVNTGSHILPGTIISNIINCYFGKNKPLAGCFNMKLPKNIANMYGVKSHSNLSVPVIIRNREIKFIDNIDVSDKEKICIDKAIKNLNEAIAKIDLAVERIY